MWNTGWLPRTVHTTGSGAAGRLSRRADGSPIAFDGVFINTDEKHETDEKLHRALQEVEKARNELLLEHEVVSAVSRVYFSIYSIDLVNDFYEEISGREHAVHRLTGSGAEHRQSWMSSAERLWRRSTRTRSADFLTCLRFRRGWVHPM